MIIDSKMLTNSNLVIDSTFMIINIVNCMLVEALVSLTEAACAHCSSQLHLVRN